MSKTKVKYSKIQNRGFAADLEGWIPWVLLRTRLVLASIRFVLGSLIRLAFRRHGDCVRVGRDGVYELRDGLVLPVEVPENQQVERRGERGRVQEGERDVHL